MMFMNKGTDGRINHFAPTAPAENAVVARSLGFHVLFMGAGHAAAHGKCRMGLAGPGNIVELALDRHDGGGFDVAWFDTLGFTFNRYHVPSAVDELMLLKH